MLAHPPPAPMLHGSSSSFFRSAPGRLSVSLCASVSRRISGAGLARCCDGSVSAPPANPSPPPRPPAASAPPILAPLPSAASWYGAAHKGNGSDSWSSGDERFRSVGSRSDPSRSSIPGKFSKYSKPISRLNAANEQRREARRDRKAYRKPMGDIGVEPDRNLVSADDKQSASPAAPAADWPRGKKAPVSPEDMPEWMHHYQFSYSEVPVSPILGFRQHPWSPFGPPEMIERPWTGSAPLKKSKKKRPEFDSFNPPPLGKKGVKYVQRPGPFPPGEGPKPGKTREEVLGAPLTPLEISQLVAIVNKGTKQLNLGRDGLTHNMLDVIHSHWKRSIVCKIKCKGVPTVDMDNVARVIEDKTGGVIIHRAGGVLYLFRGRNYNYRNRPQIPIMLWKPPDPIYPRLIQGIPKGLTLEEAKELRAKGRKVAPLCTLSKNGVYLSLVADVRAQFEVDDVVKVDCEGMNATDYKKIGAKLKELVPCTLLSFEREQIIMCRSKSIQVESGPVDPHQDKKNLDGSIDVDQSTHGTGLLLTDQQGSTTTEHNVTAVLASDTELMSEGDSHNPLIRESPGGDTSTMQGENSSEENSVFKSNVKSETDGRPQITTPGEGENLTEGSANAATIKDPTDMSLDDRPGAPGVIAGNARSEQRSLTEETFSESEVALDELSGSDMSMDGPNVPSDGYSESSADTGEDEFDALWQHAIEEGQALRLDNESGDPDVVLKQAAELSTALQDAGEEETSVHEKLEIEHDVEHNQGSPQVPPTSPFDDMTPLRVDELAKLLAP